MRAGQLSERLKFYSRAEIDDGAGNRRGAWVFEFEVWAEMRLNPGREAVAAARIEGRVPMNVRLRRSQNSLRITTGWMARDARGVDYNVTAPSPDPSDRSAVLLTMVSGGVLG